MHLAGSFCAKGQTIRTRLSRRRLPPGILILGQAALDLCHCLCVWWIYLSPRVVSIVTLSSHGGKASHSANGKHVRLSGPEQILIR